MNFRRYFAAITTSLVVSAALADVIVLKTGEQIAGKVSRFERGENSLASSHFVIEVAGKEQEIPLFKIDTVTFDGAAAAGAAPRPSAALPLASPPPAKRPAASEDREEGGAYCLSSSGKRHNSSCRYYGSTKCRSCGPKDGVACKVCGG